MSSRKKRSKWRINNFNVFCNIWRRKCCMKSFHSTAKRFHLKVDLEKFKHFCLKQSRSFCTHDHRWRKEKENSGEVKTEREMKFFFKNSEKIHLYCKNNKRSNHVKFWNIKEKKKWKEKKKTERKINWKENEKEAWKEHGTVFGRHFDIWREKGKLAGMHS
jgi:hypothetical protein